MRRRHVVWPFVCAAIVSSSPAAADDEPAAPEPETAPTEPLPTEPLPSESQPPEASPSPPQPIVVPPQSPTLGPAPFGAPGVVVVTADSSFAAGGIVYSKPSEAQYLYVDVGPGFDVFVARRLSIGGGLGFSYSNARGYVLDGSLVEAEQSVFAVGPRVGFDIPLGSVVSIYPRLTIGFRWTRGERTTLKTFGGYIPSPREKQFDVAADERRGAYVNVFVPVLLHPTQSFFIGFGPSFFHGADSSLVDQGPRTTIAGRMVVGGHWGGDRVPIANETSTEHWSRPRDAGPYRFGETRDLLISGDFQGGASYSGYARSAGYASSIGISPAIDYFVARHVSLGIGGRISSSVIDDRLSDKSVARSVTTTKGVDVRVGFEISVSDRFSLYPRVALGFATSSTAQRVAGQTSEGDSSAFGVALTLPFVIHAARHFFIGWGPYLSQDPFRWSQAASTDVRGTAYGASLLVGGWL